jgi:hypothetical protein
MAYHVAGREVDYDEIVPVHRLHHCLADLGTLPSPVILEVLPARYDFGT